MVVFAQLICDGKEVDKMTNMIRNLNKAMYWCTNFDYNKANQRIRIPIFTKQNDILSAEQR